MGKGATKYMKTWKPDTCDCVIEEIYQGTEIVGGGQVVKKCAAHSTVEDKDLYGVLYANPDGENKVKNQMYRVLLGMEDVKGLGLEKVTKNKEGNDVIELADGVDYKWTFDGLGYNRKLKVEVKGAALTKAKKDNIKAHADAKFGNGKVEII
jgi:hypothetical protein